MAEDGEVLRQLWDSYLPVAFHLSSNDLHSIKDPEPYYSMVPRLSYFTLVIDKVVVYFSQFIDSNAKSAANLWLDFLGVPLKLNYPIGLLYDLYAADIELPWIITVNFDNFPSETLVRCNTRSSLESTYMYALKEADVLKHRTPRVNTMQKRDHTALWKGLLDYKFDAFWKINRRLMTPEAPASTVAEEATPDSSLTVGGTFLHIPFRLYLVKPGAEVQHPLFLQKLVSPLLVEPRAELSPTIKEGGDKPASERPPPPLPSSQPATFGHLLSSVLAEPKVDTGESPEKVSSPLEALSSKYRFVVHGIEPSLETPLQWMSEHFSYLDNFLHIAVFEKT